MSVGRLGVTHSGANDQENAMATRTTQLIDHAGEGVKGGFYGTLLRGPDLIVEAAGPIEAVQLLVDAEKIISTPFPLTRIPDAMDVMSRRDRNKVMIQPLEAGVSGVNQVLESAA